MQFKEIFFFDYSDTVVPQKPILSIGFPSYKKTETTAAISYISF